MNRFQSFERKESRVRLGLVAALLLLSPPMLFAQGRSADEGSFRGDRAEIIVTLRDQSGEILNVAATVKLYFAGSLTAQGATSKGKASFIVGKLGDYVISVDAAGYQTAQKDVSLNMAISDQEDIFLRKDSGNGENGVAPGGPILAPKAKEAFDKALQALNENKVDEAEQQIGEAVKLAPNHPNVLYVQGVVYLKRRQWDKAQDVLEKATQIDPKHARAFSALGMALADQGKFDQSIPPLQQSLQLDPVSWDTHWTLAKAFYHEQQYDGALKESQEALNESHGAEPGIELLLAQSQTAVGNFEGAGETLRTYLKNHPNEKGAATARKWLDRLTADGKIHK
jgi:TolA-binding protein